MNRLAGETSLYLRQHANNPVDWFPWGPEALAAAKDQDRPIFLSVGYSACHWCHVMEHECFENPAIAALMNQHFVNIKVDREERPDLDQIYMTAHGLLNRGEGGGWPLSVFLAPDLTPFYAGTYFPPDNRYAPQRPSFPQLLTAIADAWATKRDQLVELGANVAEHLRGMSAGEPGDGELSPELLKGAVAALKRSFDPRRGGFGHAPKFPHAGDLRLLMRAGKRFASTEPEAMIRLTLDRMARGGMYDQVGGGFHRYSVDAEWLVPHFEKMLYDNALLPPAYVEAYQLTQDPFYKHIACETLDYVLREMTSPAGGFYSTQDADSEGEEGKFYVWSEAEIDDVLGPELAPLAKSVYAVTDHGNFEGHNILFRSKTDEQDAKLNGLTLDEFRAKLAQIKCMLYGRRGKRVWPGRDEKILAGWNGLMIAAMAQAGAVFGVPKYIEAAARAADFVLTRLRGPDGMLFRTAGETGPAKFTGYLEDHAYMAYALAELYQATFDPKWLRAADDLCDVLIAEFADEAGGGFFYTADAGGELIARMKDAQDGSVPSGNAVAAAAFLKLAVLLDRADLRDHAGRTLKAYRGLMADHPAAAGPMLMALDMHSGPMDEVAVVGRVGEPETGRALAAIRKGFRPNMVVALHDPATGTEAEGSLLAGKTARGAVTVYVCRDFACREPLVGAEAVEAAFG
jgi:uncharacterized protein YyaL (SSP411 family)